jgi:hypothetical protein
MQDHLLVGGSGDDVSARSQVALDDLGTYLCKLLALPVSRPNQSPDSVPVVEKMSGHVGADASGDAGNQNVHDVINPVLS